MTVIAMHRTQFTVIQYNGVTNIAYNAATNTYVITHSGGTNNVVGDNYVLSVLFS